MVSASTISLSATAIIRAKRSRLKKDLKSKEQRLVDILTAPPEYAETMKIFEALLAVPHIGRVNANKILRECRISPSKTIGGMTQRQRDELIAKLRWR